jgi:hypothetical protein
MLSKATVANIVSSRDIARAANLNLHCHLHRNFGFYKHCVTVADINQHKIEGVTFSAIFLDLLLDCLGPKFPGYTEKQLKASPRDGGANGYNIKSSALMACVALLDSDRQNGIDRTLTGL